VRGQSGNWLFYLDYEHFNTVRKFRRFGRTTPEYERSEEDQPFDPDVFSRREVNARLRQYAKGDRDWLFSY